MRNGCKTPVNFVGNSTSVSTFISPEIKNTNNTPSNTETHRSPHYITCSIITFYNTVHKIIDLNRIQLNVTGQ